MNRNVRFVIFVVAFAVIIACLAWIFTDIASEATP